MIFLTEQDEIS